jgi:hypothetical protein
MVHVAKGLFAPKNNQKKGTKKMLKRTFNLQAPNDFVIITHGR